MKLFFMFLAFSITCYASVDYIDVMDSLSKDPKKTVIVIGCTDGSSVKIPVSKTERYAVKKYKIDITKYCN
jgi:hypothetical protein